MKVPPNDGLYISPNLAGVVNAIMQKPLTLITAGSGFGKTTAVMNCLKRASRDTAYHWYTCFGEPPERAWEGVCRLISFADTRIGEFLSKLELPTLNHLGHISTLMGEISCDMETILVIDNFQLAGFPAPYRLLNALAMHGCEKLHLVVLSHPLYADAGLAAADPRIYRISQEAFCFTLEDIRKLFSLSGASLNEEQAARLCAATDGWIAALQLHLAGFLADGKLNEGVGINELMEMSFWRRLDERQQGLFLGLSLLGTFTEAQAARMLGRDVMPDELWTSVYNSAFVRKTENEYMLHSLLKSFLSVKLLTRPDAFRRRMYGRAGAACQLQGKNVEAVLFFTDAGEDVNALSVPLTSLQLAELVRTKAERLDALLSRCRAEMLEGRWLLLLGMAVKAFLNGKAALARTALTRLKQLRELPDGDTEHQRSVAAALEMVASFRAYNDISEMCRHHAAAIALLDDAQDFYVTNDSWSFCIPSVVYMFWRESGKLFESIALLREGIPHYALLGGGKGLGGPEMMAAEAALLFGMDEQSVTQGYLARTVAQRAGQDSILFCVYTLLARAALLRGDAAAFTSTLHKIERHAFEGKEFLCVTTSEVALGFLYSLLDMEDKIPGWMLSPESVRQILYPISAPFALIVTLRYIRKHAPQELIGTAQAYIRETDALHHLLPKLYFLLEEAAWYEQNKDREKAREKTELALSLALPDQVCLPFAEYYAELSDVLNDGQLQCADAEALDRVRALGRRFVSGAAAVRAAMNGAAPLTPREREIALLAQKRISTKKIAETLCVSPSTVKNTLSKVYSKLDISGKPELEGRQF